MTHNEVNFMKNLALENLLGQGILKEYVAVSLKEKNYFMFSIWFIQI